MRLAALVLAALAALLSAPAALAEDVRLKDLGRFSGWRDNPLVGYGVVTGLSGTGDSARSEVTRQALRNVLSRMGIVVTSDQVQSRNVAIVMITATLPPSASVGDRIDVTVASAGDARSLAGGTLLMTPLLGPDQQPYAIAQGALVVSGYRFDADQNLRQKNFPTSGVLPGGATVEKAVNGDIKPEDGAITFVLRRGDFTTAENAARSINMMVGSGMASVLGADRIRIATDGWSGPMNTLLARIENVTVHPENVARVVVNERSGTIVAGGGVQISDVVIAQGDVKVSVQIDNAASQPGIYGGYVRDASGLVVTNTRLDVTEDTNAVMHFPSATVADLAQGLARAKVPTRTMIDILQAMKAAGALHAEIVVQ
ncbi:MAG: flagellar basal body P-ring protein FlgI [Sphingomonadales bacterium]|nr:flagellar basal body P-ring protein FlgI [Sphingomonadales bacterium]